MNDSEIKSLLKGFDTPPEETAVVAILERNLGVGFPALFKRILALGEELHIGPLKGKSGDDIHFDFHAIKTTHFEYVGQTIKEAIDNLVEINKEWINIIPFGAVGNGDQYCFDYRNSIEPSIVLFNHERLADYNPFTLEAESMHDFISNSF